MIRVIIVEDKIDDAHHLKRIISDFFKDEITVVSISKNVDAAFNDIVVHQPDLIFLDIKLGQRTGFDLLSKFEKINFKVIFTTSHGDQEYMLKAIRLSALDYLLKPVKKDALRNAINRYKELITERTDKRLENLLMNLQKPFKRIHIDSKNISEFVDIPDIAYFEGGGQGSGIIIHLKGDKTERREITYQTTLDDWENDLSASGFVRIHRSFLVNKDYIDKVEMRSEWAIILKLKNHWLDKKSLPKHELRLPVSEGRRELLRKAMGIK